jgi:DHA1 family bicyclomycin/chloramphenicol resistance-like MFS transporter
MSTTARSWLIVLLAAIVATTPLAVDMYLPAMPRIAHDLHAHIGDVQQSLSIFLGAYAIGMLIFGPLADILGRRPLVFFGLCGFSVCSFALANTERIDVFLILRALQAFCGGAATVTVPGIVRFLYQEHPAKGMSAMSMIMMLAPLLAPSIGSLILLVSDWHSIFLVMGIYALVILILAAKFLPEIDFHATHSLHERRKHLRRSFFAGYKIVFSHATVRPLILSMVCGSFAFFTFITAVPFVYINYFGVSEQVFSLLFGFNVSMLIVANLITNRLVVRVGSLRLLRVALVGALIGATLLVVVNYYQWGLWLTVLCIALLMASLVIVSTNTDAIVLSNFPHNSGTAAAVTGTLRFGSGAFSGSMLAYFYTGTALPFSLLMLSGVLGVLLCQFWFFIKSKG